VEILRALARDAAVIVMDEPTAALRPDEAQSLHRHVKRLRDQGTTVVFISHYLNETLLLADSVTVLRDGRLVRTRAASEETPESLVTAMLGRETDLVFPDKRLPDAGAPVMCSVRGLGRDPAFDDVSFDVRAGEIVGLAGLIGSGRSEVARAVFGADRIDRGAIQIGGRTFAPSSPKDAIRVGIAMLPESRKEQGLLLHRSILENVTLPHLDQLNQAGIVRQKAGERRAGEVVRRVDVRTSGLGAPVATLSGGNQQKTLFAKWLFREPRLLIADEPTRGVDVGAKMAIYRLIASLAEGGMAVLLISSELEEIIGLAHRILVMRDGRIVGQFDGRVATQDDVLKAAFTGGAGNARGKHE
jgi:ABC-type sugar transport system ATPase subunit